MIAIDDFQERIVLKNETVFGKIKYNFEKEYDMAIDGYPERGLFLKVKWILVKKIRHAK